MNDENRDPSVPVTTAMARAGCGPAITFTRLLAVFFLIDGVWEIFSPVTFGYLSGNATHGLIHIVLGVLGLVLAGKGNVCGYLTGVGILLLVVGALWFVPPTRDLLLRLLNLNRNVALLNLVLGVLCLIFGATCRSGD